MGVYFNSNHITPIIQDTTLFKKVVDKSITTLTAEDLAGVTSIGDYAFYNCKALTTVELSSTVTRLKSASFYSSTNISTLLLGDNLESIEYVSFESSKIEKIVLPLKLNNLGGGVFRYCSGLRKIVLLPHTPPTVASSTFTQIKNSAIFYIYLADIPNYTVATNWVSILQTYSYAPLVDTVSDLSNIDTTVYTRACVVGGKEYVEYTYDGSQWNIVT